MHKVVEQLPTFQSCKRKFYNEKKIILKLSTSRSHINVQGPWTTAGEEFIMSDDKEDDGILFSPTQHNLEHLVTAKTMYGD